MNDEVVAVSADAGRRILVLVRHRPPWVLFRWPGRGGLVIPKAGRSVEVWLSAS
jgi:hypothetical protein